MTKVVKFGGTSLAEAKQFLKVADIIRSDPDRRYVVPSAPGKRFSGDTKVTDMFYACYDSASRGGDFEEIFQKIKNRYNDIISGPFTMRSVVASSVSKRLIGSEPS